MESQQTLSVLHTPVSNALAWKVESMSREQRDKNIIRLWHGTTEHRAKRIIEDYHKGRLRVLISTPDKGTTMEIALPLDKY